MPTAPALKAWKKAVEDKLLTEQTMQAINDDFTTGITLKKEQKYSQAKFSLNKTLSAYQSLLREFIAAKELYPTQQIVAKNKQSWLTLSKQQTHAEPIPTKILNLISQAEMNLNNGKLQLALTNYQQANTYFHTAIEQQKQQLQLAAQQQEEAKRLLNERLLLAQQQELQLKKTQDEQQKINEQAQLLAEQKQREIELQKQLENEQLRIQAEQAQLKIQQHQEMLEKLVGTMITIPAGQFNMGCIDETECLNSEKPEPSRVCIFF
ncbi:MAG: hypothetical protein Q9N32_00790 [Gammaproteobacteria bacterium]|nr:hypothetical protein [Gammaproteobacteria bacterium]